jgi:hypothetical protein
MNVPRRRILQSAGGVTATVGGVALAGCQSLTETQHLLVVENETDTEHAVTVVVRRATDGTTSEPSTDSTATDTDGTTSDADATTTSTRFVVDFRYEMPGDSRREGPNVLPTDGTFEVFASVPDLGTARTTYTDRESVRVTVTDDGVLVDTFTPT